MLSSAKRPAVGGVRRGPNEAAVHGAEVGLEVHFLFLQLQPLVSKNVHKTQRSLHCGWRPRVPLPKTIVKVMRRMVQMRKDAETIQMCDCI